MTAGMLVALGFTIAMCSLLYEIRPVDLSVYAAAGALVVCVALVSSYLPALRATRLDPLMASRNQ
jgi:ABC-type antimicrobial peptide transport system permease subunit